jgi:dTDP-4-amino-4,6-dideoxygalactose transaminase
VANGLDALTIALKSLDIGPGSNVAVPAHTFIATWLAVSAVGATPIAIDCDDSGLIDLDALENEIRSFDAVIPVHMHGQMVDMGRLSRWAKNNGIKIIEDCAQAHGAISNGRYAGTWGDVGAFSFYPTKNLGALGDAGIIVTNDKKIALRMKSLGNYGSKPENKYQYSDVGMNSRLDPLQAAFLDINLRYLNQWNKRRSEIAQTYISTLSKFNVPMLVKNREKSVWHHFIIFVQNRDKVRLQLEKLNIYTEIHYPESAEDSFLKITGQKIGLSRQAQELARRTLSLPISPWMNDEQVAYVTSMVTSDKILRSIRFEI